MEWQSYMTQHKIYYVIDQRIPITSIEIKEVKETESSVMNELLGLLSIQDNIA